jgi:hypothetical protein
LNKCPNMIFPTPSPQKKRPRPVSVDRPITSLVVSVVIATDSVWVAITLLAARVDRRCEELRAGEAGHSLACGRVRRQRAERDGAYAERGEGGSVTVTPLKPD